MTNEMAGVLRKWAAVGGLVAAVVLFAGCGMLHSSTQFTELDKQAPPPETKLGSDLLSPGDILTVNITDIPNPPPPFEVKVRDDGKITLLLNKPFVAAGKTTGDLETEIRTNYVPSIYRNMTISLRAQNGFYSVSGEVKAPGRQPYLGPTTVLRAIASCGDFTDFSRKTKVRLTHGNGKSVIINCIKAQDHPELDPPVYPGDRVHVPRRLL